MILWLIQASGYKDSFRPSSAGLSIWNEAVARQLTFLPGEKRVLPGDIVIFPRSSADLAELRSGKSNFSPAHPGIVYAVNGNKLTIISGNVRNAIRLQDRTLSEKIIGFVRLSDG